MCAFWAMFTCSCVTRDFHKLWLQPANSHRPAALPHSMHCTGTGTRRVITSIDVSACLTAGRPDLCDLRILGEPVLIFICCWAPASFARTPRRRPSALEQRAWRNFTALGDNSYWPGISLMGVPLTFVDGDIRSET